MSYPAGDTVIEEINVNGVILHIANGKSCFLGTYHLYEKVMQITTPTYELPNYLEKPNIISNFPSSGKNVGDTIDWRPPSHEHPEKITSSEGDFTWNAIWWLKTRDIDNNGVARGKPSDMRSPSVTILTSGQNLNNTSRNEIKEKYQPEKIALTPYIILDYKG